MVRNRIAAEPFDYVRFGQVLMEATGAASVPVVRQASYLARYCRQLGAQTIVREDHYIDRHFLDEYGAYYSRNLDPPSNSVRRFHLFTAAFDDPQFGRYLDEAVRLPREDVAALQGRLSNTYLGFITVRPIPSVPIGRTVLRRLQDGTHRDIWATGNHDVHVANLTLQVEGIAFQQQDVAVGACATAAVWSALSRVARKEGIRAPTPAEVSAAAGRHLLPLGRTMPAVAGLTNEQLSEAIRSTGFAPEAVRADERPEFFMIALHTYLLSGIPVVLGLEDPEGQHAVTAVGFQTDNTSHRLLESSIPVRSARIKKLYIHDDRLGPYARAFVMPRPRQNDFEDSLFLQIETERDNSVAKPDPADLEEWLIESAIVPVYPKLRLSVSSLITLGELLADLMEQVVGTQNAAGLSVEFQYERGGTYLARLNSKVFAPSAAFLREIALSRWCGIVRWFLRDGAVAEFVYDTTDILRDVQRMGGELLSAVVCIDPRFRQALSNTAAVFNVPFL
jgi:hypothetical protein